LFGHQTTKIPYSCEKKKKNIEELRAEKEEKEEIKKR
jgi:hypothetical protein